jgi:hypothetical protein
VHVRPGLEKCVRFGTKAAEVGSFNDSIHEHQNAAGWQDPWLMERRKTHADYHTDLRIDLPDWRKRISIFQRAAVVVQVDEHG